MNCKIKRKSWRRLAASLLAGLCLLTGSGAALAAQAAGGRRYTGDSPGGARQRGGGHAGNGHT